MIGEYFKCAVVNEDLFATGKTSSNWQFGACEWKTGRDENPSCKHKKIYSNDRKYSMWHYEDTPNLVHLARYWICSKCYARGVDVLVSVKKDNKLFERLNRRRNRIVLPFENLEGTLIDIYEYEKEDEAKEDSNG